MVLKARTTPAAGRQEIGEQWWNIVRTLSHPRHLPETNGDEMRMGQISEESVC